MADRVQAQRRQSVRNAVARPVASRATLRPMNEPGRFLVEPEPVALALDQRAVGNRVIARRLAAGTLPPGLMLAQRSILGNRAMQRLLAERD